MEKVRTIPFRTGCSQVSYKLPVAITVIVLASLGVALGTSGIISYTAAGVCGMMVVGTILAIYKKRKESEKGFQEKKTETEADFQYLNPAATSS